MGSLRFAGEFLEVPDRLFDHIELVVNEDVCLDKLDAIWPFTVCLLKVEGLYVCGGARRRPLDTESKAAGPLRGRRP